MAAYNISFKGFLFISINQNYTLLFIQSTHEMISVRLLITFLINPEKCNKGICVMSEGDTMINKRKGLIRREVKHQ